MATIEQRLEVLEENIKPRSLNCCVIYLNDDHVFTSDQQRQLDEAKENGQQVIVVRYV